MNKEKKTTQQSMPKFFVRTDDNRYRNKACEWKLRTNKKLIFKQRRRGLIINRWEDDNKKTTIIFNEISTENQGYK